MLVLPPRLEAAAEARGAVRSACAHGRLHDDAASTAELLVSELVTNAVLHARTVTTLRVLVGGGVLRVDVEDEAPAAPVQLRCVGAWAESGRGLGLVDALAARWGVRPTERGKAVWFEVRAQA